MKRINKRNIAAAYARWLNYSKGWKTNKKIVVIESDDWGSIRTSSKEAYDALNGLGYDMTKSPYTLDSLESNEDLIALFEVLNSVKDANGNPACFTANMIMANPDFEAIKKSNFSKYSYEKVNDTLARYKDRDRVNQLWKQGHRDKVFFPQLHAREHIRYWDWLNDLASNNEETHLTFKYNMCGVPRAISKFGISYFHPPYIDDEILLEENVDLQALVSEGVKLFNEEFGFESITTIAPNCGWTKSIEKVWADNGIKYIQGGFLQEHHYKNTTEYIPHYLGQKSKENEQVYLVRNCTFEPAYSNDANYWQSALKQVEKAFVSNRPAIISSHRMNYIGAIKVENREKGLNQLQNLLRKIIEKHPDTIFMSSSDFVKLLNK